MQIDPREYLSLPLEAHALLEDIPLHDVWAINLRKGRTDRTVLDVAEIFNDQFRSLSSFPVKVLFGIRSALGRTLGWDGKSELAGSRLFQARRLSEDQRERSLTEPGTSLGPFRLVYAFRQELVGEVRNATVHAFSCQVLQPLPDSYRFFWAIYVAPVSAWTPVYMSVIDPFRRWIVYPTILRKLQQVWEGREMQAQRRGGGEISQSNSG